ncbi:hypothetical protein C8R44DRAFT_687730, partial [Mycena epipterygia]
MSIGYHLFTWGSDQSLLAIQTSSNIPIMLTLFCIHYQKSLCWPDIMNINMSHIIRQQLRLFLLTALAIPIPVPTPYRLNLLFLS